MTVIHASEVNYVILTADQFANDYASYANETSSGNPPEGPVLVLYDDEELPIAMIEGTNNAMLAELVSDINDYAKRVADPGAIEAKVGASQTVLPDRG